MPYDADIEEAIDTAIGRWRGFVKKKMFGGVAYLLRGNVSFGVFKKNLIIRCGPDAYETELMKPGVRQFDITGRPMRGWIMVPKSQLTDDDALVGWLTLAKKFTSKLPPK